MDDSGFLQWWIYFTVKNIHFTKNTYDITKYRLPKREYYVKQWNEKYKDTEGILFYRLQNKIPYDKNTYIRLFSYYYIENNGKFHIHNIFDDNFKLFVKYEHELRNLEEIVFLDFLKLLNLAAESRLQLKKIFFDNNKFPLVFSKYNIREISPHSMIAFNLAFNIFDKLKERKNLNIVEKEKIKNYNKLFDNYQKVVYTFFKDKDWKNILKQKTKNI